MTDHPGGIGSQKVVLQLRAVRGHDDQVGLHRLRHVEDNFADRTLANNVLDGEFVGHFIGDKILEPGKNFFADLFLEILREVLANNAHAEIGNNREHMQGSTTGFTLIDSQRQGLVPGAFMLQVNGQKYVLKHIVPPKAFAVAGDGPD